MKYKFSFFILVYFLNPVFGFGNIDIEEGIEISFKDKETAEGLINQAKAIYRKEPIKAIDYLTKSLKISISDGDVPSQIKAYQLLGEINFDLEQYSLSTSNSKKALKLIEGGNSLKRRKYTSSSINYSDQKLDLYQQLGASLEKEEKLDDALGFYQLFLDANSEPISFKFHDADSKPSETKPSTKKMEQKPVSNEEEVKLAMARIYSKKKEFNLSKISLSGGSDSTFNPSISYSNSSSYNVQAGRILWQQNDTSALGYLGNSVKQARSEGRTDVETQANDEFANYYEKNEDFKEARGFREKNIKILKNTSDTASLADNFLKKGISESKLGMQDSAKKSIDIAQQLGEEIGDLKIQQKSFKELSKIAESQGQTNKALELYKKYVMYQDSAVRLKEKELDQKLIISEEYSKKQQKIDLLEKNEEINEKTIELLQESSRNQKILIYSLFGGLLLIFGSGYLVYKNMRQRRLANQLIALRSLRSQMNPHFIFNALNSVNLHIAQKDERTANKYLTEFSRLMRLVLEQSQKDFIPLQQELEMIKLYINLEHDRFKDKFDFQLNIDPELDEDSLQIPPMLIQPYIENAIWHGLRYKEEKGLLTVSYNLEGNSIRVSVEDNGIGREKSKQIKTKNQLKTQSTGMYNIESRLKIINSMFKTKISLNINDLNSHHGTIVEVEIPINNSTTS